jgi:FKBP-type peptidyl-prolyl cis-trans isomerase FklB
MKKSHPTLGSMRRWTTLAVVLLLNLWSPTADASNEEGLKFLAENRDKPGVIELPSGMQYKILEQGSGIHHPLPSTPCECHYAGRLLDGTEFDSSYSRGKPSSFAPNQVIKGWTEAMQMMVQGDKWELYIPSELAYGDRGSPPKIPPDSVLVFTIEIVEIPGDTSDLPLAMKCVAATKEKCSEKEVQYLDKIATWTDDKKKAEHERLKKISLETKNMKPDLANWILQRFKLLEQLVQAALEPEKAQAEAEL